jgi:hypothetical protein
MMRISHMTLGTLLVAATALVPFREHRATINLHRQVQSLREQAAECRELADDNRRLSQSLRSGQPELAGNVRDELLALRGEVSRLRWEQSEFGAAPVPAAAEPRVADQPGQSASPPPSSFLSKDSWSFAGYEDMNSALQSVFWAFGTGEPMNITNSMSAREQTRWASSEKAAARMAELMRETTAVRVLDLVTPDGKSLSDSDTVVVPWWAEGPNSPYKFVLRRIDAEWKLDGDPFSGYNILDNLGCVGYNVLGNVGSK